MGALGDEKLEADFDPAAGGVEAVDEGQSRGGVGEVEGNDEALLRGLRGGVSQGMRLRMMVLKFWEKLSPNDKGGTG